MGMIFAADAAKKKGTRVGSSGLRRLSWRCWRFALQHQEPDLLVSGADGRPAPMVASKIPTPIGTIFLDQAIHKCELIPVIGAVFSAIMAIKLFGLILRLHIIMLYGVAILANVVHSEFGIGLTAGFGKPPQHHSPTSPDWPGKIIEPVGHGRQAEVTPLISVGWSS